VTGLDIQARNLAIFSALDQGGATPEELAARYGISRGQVYAIVAAAAAGRDRAEVAPGGPADDTAEVQRPGALVPTRRWNETLPLPERYHRALDLYARHAAAVEALPDPDARRDPRAAQYHKSARTESTRRMYKVGIWLYLAYCEADNRREVPANPATMEGFAVHLMHRKVEKGRNKGQIGLAPASIRLYCSAVRTFHRIQAENPPDLGLANGVILGYENDRNEARDSTGKKVFHDGEGSPALRLPTLKQIFDVCDPSTPRGARDRALLSCGWAIMSRRTELTRIDLEHITVVDQGLEVRLDRTKTMKKGRTVGIPDRPNLGMLNPVPNILRFRDLMISRGLTGGPYLRGIDKAGRIHGEPGWAGAGGLRLDPSTVEDVIRRRAIQTGVPNAELFTGHSLRRGGANDMYAAGADTRAVARQGGWGEKSPVVFRYLEDISHWERNALDMVTWTYPQDDEEVEVPT
jgi:integrase